MLARAEYQYMRFGLGFTLMSDGYYTHEVRFGTVYSCAFTKARCGGARMRSDISSQYRNNIQPLV